MRLTATLRWVETHYRRLSVVAAATAALATAPVNGQDPGVVQIASELSGLRYGISVTDLDGNVLIAHRADERFMPASNAKLLVTAAALAAATELSTMDHGLQVVSEWTGSGPPTLVLVGRGDPTVGFSTDCEVRCLETLAEAVAASGITEIGDIVGDDQWFADEPKPLGWSWDDLKFGHGTSISAIAVNDNVVPIRVSPSNSPGSALVASWIDDGSNYFSLQNEAKTSGANEPRALMGTTLSF
ncbi:MAG: D-alanyl-D-alanine carboxypeptidase, partial [Pseudomonadota bacterium]